MSTSNNQVSSSKEENDDSDSRNEKIKSGEEVKKFQGNRNSMEGKKIKKERKSQKNFDSMHSKDSNLKNITAAEYEKYIHELNSEEPPIYKCYFCKEGLTFFKLRVDLIKHLSSEHGVDLEYSKMISKQVEDDNYFSYMKKKVRNGVFCNLHKKTLYQNCVKGCRNPIFAHIDNFSCPIHLLMSDSACQHIPNPFTKPVDPLAEALSEFFRDYSKGEKREKEIEKKKDDKVKAKGEKKKDDKANAKKEKKKDDKDEEKKK